LPRACAEGGGRESPGVRVPFFRVAERKEPKKGRPCTLRPFASLRATCGARSSGVPQNSLRACGAPFRQLRQVRARSVCPSAHAHPTPCAPRRILKGWGPEHPHGPLLRSAPPHGRKRLALRNLGRAQQRPVWLFGCPPPSGCACGGAVVGWHGRRSAHASCSSSPQLSERSCNAAK